MDFFVEPTANGKQETEENLLPIHPFTCSPKKL
jgi:hypothetical protein